MKTGWVIKNRKGQLVAFNKEGYKWSSINDPDIVVLRTYVDALAYMRSYSIDNGFVAPSN